MIRDTIAEDGLLAAYLQGMETGPMDPTWFTGPRMAVAMVLAEKERPSSAHELSVWLTQASVTGVDARGWYDTPPPDEPLAVRDGLVQVMVQRELAVSGNRVRQLAQQGGPDMIDLVQAEIARAVAPLLTLTRDDKTKAAHEWMEGFLKGLAAPTGWRQSWCPVTDQMIGPLGPQMMLVLTGQPGIGKSSVASAMALDLSLQGAKVMYASPDMGCKQTLARMCSTLSGVPFSSIWRHSTTEPLTQLEADRVEIARQDIEARGILFEDVANTLEICSLARTRGVDVLIVDYIAQFRVPGVPGEGSLNQEQVTASTFALRALAGHCAVIVVSHKKTNSEPATENVAWSAELGNQADKVLWLQDDPDMPNIVTALLLKNRGGPTGQVMFYFLKPLMTYIELKIEKRGFVVGQSAPAPLTL
jgi:replicative DNA helicase